jgi:hypothetical protein
MIRSSWLRFVRSGTLLFALVGRGVLPTDDDHALATAATRFLNVLLAELCAIAVAEQHGSHRDVHIHVRVADAESLSGLVADPAILEDADHREPRVAHLDGAANRFLGR